MAGHGEENLLEQKYFDLKPARGLGGGSHRKDEAWCLAVQRICVRPLKVVSATSSGVSFG